MTDLQYDGVIEILNAQSLVFFGISQADWDGIDYGHRILVHLNKRFGELIAANKPDNFMRKIVEWECASNNSGWWRWIAKLECGHERRDLSNISKGVAHTARCWDCERLAPKLPACLKCGESDPNWLDVREDEVECGRCGETSFGQFSAWLAQQESQ